MIRKRKIFLRALCVLFSLSFLAASLSAGVVIRAAEATAAAPAPRHTAYWSSPALCTDAGTKLDLTACAVQFDRGSEPVSAGVTWKNGNDTVTEFTPAAPGVYPLTAALGGSTRTVYVAAKAPADTEYVLYENDFSADPTADLRVIQKTSGTSFTYDAAAGNIVLNASNSGSGYVRVLLPEFLDAFGDAVMEASVKVSEPNGSDGRWGSLMFRVQRKDYPYMQAAFRFDSTLSNGTEIAQRTEADAWNVMQKKAVAAIKNKFVTVKADFAGRTCTTYFDGTKALTETLTPYYDGAMGFQVRGLKMTVDSVRVTVNPAASSGISVVPGHYASPRDAATHLSLSPILISDISEKADFDSVLENSPAVAIFSLVAAEDGTKAVIINGTNVTRVPMEDVMKALDGKVIPAFRVTTQTAADALVQYLHNNDIRDAYVLSDDMNLISRARAGWKYLYCAADFSSFSGDDWESMRNAAISAGANVVLIPSYSMTRERVEYLEDRYLCAWVESDGEAVSDTAAVNCGVLGIITPDRAATEKVFTEYYEENTIALLPNVIGHRGVPSAAQENSLAGCVKAFEYGADMVENDIYVSADGVLVIMHDSTIDRTTNGSGTVTKMTTAQLAKYKIDINTAVAGEPIPTLEEYFTTFKDNGRAIVIELKSDNTNVAAPLAKLVNKYDILNQIVVISFYPDVIAAVRREIPGVSAAYLNSSIAPNEDAVPETAAQLLPTLRNYNAAYSPSYAAGALGEKLTRALLDRGVTTWIWTVNDQKLFDRYFLTGTRGLTTNYSQWASDYGKDLTLTEGEAEGRYGVVLTTYQGKTSNVNSRAKAVIVDDGGTGARFDVATGTFVGTKAGEAQVFFTVSNLTTSGSRYWLVTELTEVKVRAENEAPSTHVPEAPEMSTASPDPETPDGTSEPTEAAATGEVKTGGCGSAVGCGAILLCAACALVLRRRNEKNK